MWELFIAFCLFVGFLCPGVALWFVLSRVSGRNQQPQGGNQEGRLLSINLGKVLTGIGFVVVAGSILLILLFFLSIVSCAHQAVQIAGAEMENWDRAADERYEQQEEAEEREAARLIAVEEDKERVEAVQASIERWLLMSSAFSLLDGWKNLNGSSFGLVKISKTERSLVFPIVPYAGTHLPPVELALAPAGTVFLREDTEMYGGMPDRYLWAVYGKKHRGEVVIASNSIDSPSLLLETRYSDGDPGSESKCKIIVRYPNLAAAREDGTRLVLERLFTTEDFDQSIRVMDLPTVIEGVPVCWDLVVRCYPAWEDPDDPNRGGRWMPSPFLDQGYLTLSPPSLRIEYSETYEGKSSDVSGGAAVLSFPEETPEDPDRYVIWRDNERLLGIAERCCFRTSSKEMTGRVLAWRQRNGYAPVVWNGGESLYIWVSSPPDRDDESFGVTVRVILRVQPLEL